MEIIVMPKLGFNMEEGVLTRWYRKEGEAIKKGEPLFSMETDKTGIDVEATLDGVVGKLLVSEGDRVPVTQPIAIVARQGEDIAAGAEDALARWNETVAGDENKSHPAGARTAAAFDFDLIVVGGGPGGYVAAIRAAQLGLHAAVVEKERVGGVCLNRGCIPTKTLLRSLAALKEVRRADQFGVGGLEGAVVSLDMKAVQARKTRVVSELVSGVEGLLQKNRVALFSGEGIIQNKNTVRVNGEDLTTKNIIIATGSKPKPFAPQIVQTKNMLTSDALLAMDQLPKEIVILGGGAIGIELGYFLAGAGTKVVVLEFTDRILPYVDGEMGRMVRKDLEAMGITIVTGAAVTDITDDSISYTKDGKTEKRKAAHVLAATGRVPNPPAELEKLGVRLDRGALVTDNHLRTNVEGIYGAGDVNGKCMLAHKASAEGMTAAENIAGLDRVMKYNAIPGFVCIEPEIAFVGPGEEAARAKYPDIQVGRFPLTANGKAKVMGNEQGMVKVIIREKYKEILGVHIYSPDAIHMISEATVAIRAEATAEESAAAIRPHPAISEAIMEAFHAALDGAIHC